MIQIQPPIQQVSSYITHLFTTLSGKDTSLIYHNLAHTIAVVSRTQQIASFYQLDKNDLYIILTAAWFHDCGHLYGPEVGHESRSVLIMEEFMRGHLADKPTIQQIANCILSTKLPTNPINLLDEILCDADLFHLGTKDFFELDLLVKMEHESRNDIVTADWEENLLNFLQSHRYYTKYCSDLLDSGKAENISALIKKITAK